MPEFLSPPTQGNPLDQGLFGGDKVSQDRYNLLTSKNTAEGLSQAEQLELQNLQTNIPDRPHSPLTQHELDWLQNYREKQLQVNFVPNESDRQHYMKLQLRFEKSGVLPQITTDKRDTKPAEEEKQIAA